MTDIEMLPLPEADGFMETFDTYGCPIGSEDAWGEETVKETIRANVARHTAAKDAEIEALREEVAEQKALNSEWLDMTEWVQQTIKPRELGRHRADILCQRIKQAEARADRLAEALRMIAKQGPHYGPDGTYKTWRHWADIARAALDQEVGNG